MIQYVYIQNYKRNGMILQMKTFIYKHIIKPKHEREHVTHEQMLFTIAVCVLPLYIVAYVGIVKLYALHDDIEQSQRIDKCRIKSMYVENDGTPSYICKSVKTDEMLIIHESESQNLIENAYINRPVIIYKNGTVK